MTEFNNTNRVQEQSDSKTAEAMQSLEVAKELVEKAPAKKNYTPFVLLALLLILIAGGLYYYSLVSGAQGSKVEVVEPVRIGQPTVTPTPTTTATPPPVSVQDLQNEADSIVISTSSADLTDLNKDIQGL